MKNRPELRDYQVSGIDFMHQVKGGILLADEPGTGKTAQVSSLAYRQSLWPLLVVCPATIKGNWERELRMWADADSVCLSGKDPYDLPDPLPKAVIVNYDILYEWQHTLGQIPWRCIAFDEAHYLANRNSKRTKAARYLGKRTSKVIAMTGTPVMNRPADFWPILNLIRPAEFPSFPQFAWKFCDPRKRPWGWDYTGSSNLSILHEMIQPFTLRRKKEDVLDLPTKTQQIVPIQLSEEARQELDEMEADFIGWLKENSKYGSVTSAKKAEAITRTGAMLRHTARLKARAVVEWARDWLANDSGKLVVFAHHKAMVDVLERRILPDNCVTIDGSTPTKHRTAIVERFQNDPSVRLMVANIKAAGVGLTLTSASQVAFAELWWTPSAIEQASDRIHRISQTKECIISFLVVAGTIEEKIASAIQTKQQVSDAIVDGKNQKSMPILDMLLGKHNTKGGLLGGKRKR